MHAILISAENLDKITEAVDLPENELTFIKTCANKRRFFVTGVESHGDILPWMILPEYRLRRRYDYDATKIETDWDQIVRL